MEQLNQRQLNQRVALLLEEVVNCVGHNIESDASNLLQRIHRVRGMCLDNPHHTTTLNGLEDLLITSFPIPPQRDLLANLQTAFYQKEVYGSSPRLEAHMKELKNWLNSYYHCFGVLLEELKALDPTYPMNADRIGELRYLLKITSDIPLNDDDIDLLLGKEPVKEEKSPLEVLLSLAPGATSYTQALHLAFHHANVAHKLGIKEALFNGDAGYNAAAIRMGLPTVDTSLAEAVDPPIILNVKLFGRHLERVLIALGLIS